MPSSWRALRASRRVTLLIRSCWDNSRSEGSRSPGGTRPRRRSWRICSSASSKPLPARTGRSTDSSGPAAGTSAVPTASPAAPTAPSRAPPLPAPSAARASAAGTAGRVSSALPLVTTGGSPSQAMVLCHTLCLPVPLGGIPWQTAHPRSPSTSCAHVSRTGRSTPWCWPSPTCRAGCRASGSRPGSSSTRCWSTGPRAATTCWPWTPRCGPSRATRCPRGRTATATSPWSPTPRPCVPSPGTRAPPC